MGLRYSRNDRSLFHNKLSMLRYKFGIIFNYNALASSILLLFPKIPQKMNQYKCTQKL